MLLPYGLVFLYGLRMDKLSDRQTLTIGVLTAAVSIAVGLYLYMETGGFVPTQDYKYPPRLYYLAYALAASSLLYLYLREKSVTVFRTQITWISENSLWIFLWHILYIYLWDFLMADIDIAGIWLAKFITIFSASCLTIYIQKMILERTLPILPGSAQKWLKITFG